MPLCGHVRIAEESKIVGSGTGTKGFAEAAKVSRATTFMVRVFRRVV
jgi:hypothetical protein